MYDELFLVWIFKSEIENKIKSSLYNKLVVIPLKNV